MAKQSSIVKLKGLATKMGNAMYAEDFERSKALGKQMNAIMPGSAAKAVRAINRGDAPSSAFRAPGPNNAAVQIRMRKGETFRQASAAVAAMQDRPNPPSANNAAVQIRMGKGETLRQASLNVQRAASLRQSKGGGVGDQPRVPAGNPDGGQFTKG